MRVAVVGAGVAGLACATRLAATGHDVTLLEATDALGGKCARVDVGGVAFDAGPSLLTMPHVLEALLRDVGAEPLELLRVEPVTRYRFADGTSVEISADRDRSSESLEAWSPGAGRDWLRLLEACDAMWGASERFLTGPPPLPPRRPGPGEPPPDPRDALVVKPWLTLRGFASGLVADPRLRMVVDRFATYAGSDPRDAPAALALAGYVEHAFGAWHPRCGLHRIVEVLAARFAELGGTLELGAPVAEITREGCRATGVVLADGSPRHADAVVFTGDALALEALLEPGAQTVRTRRPRSCSGLALMLKLDRPEPGAAHHEIRFPADYDAEFDDLFARKRPVADPALYLSTPGVTDPDVPAEALFVLVNAPAGIEADWDAEADRVVERLGLSGGVAARAIRSPEDLAVRTGAVGGAIYGARTRGRLGALQRQGLGVRGVRGLLRAGGTVHPGGGLPLVMLGAATAAREIGPA